MKVTIFYGCFPLSEVVSSTLESSRKVDNNTKFIATSSTASIDNLGIALIINKEKKLAGVITDGDIKRIMNTHNNTEEILIKKVMTRKPLQISSDILAAEALSVLEKNNISVLPVIDKSVIKGVITLQDLIKSIN